MKNNKINLEDLEDYQCFIYGIARYLLDALDGHLSINDEELPKVFYHHDLACVVALKRLAKLGLINVSFDNKTTIISYATQQEEAA